MVTATGAIDASVAVSLPELQAKLAGALEAQAQFSVTPPSLTAVLSAALAAVAQLQAAIAADLPNATISVTGIAAIIAELEASIASLSAQIAISASLKATLGQAGVHLYRWAGAAGEAVPGGVPGVGDSVHVDGIFLVAATNGAWQAIESLLTTA